MTGYQQFWLIFSVISVLCYFLWLLIHSAAFRLLRIRIERLEAERATHDQEWETTVAAATADGEPVERRHKNAIRIRIKDGNIGSHEIWYADRTIVPNEHGHAFHILLPTGDNLLVYVEHDC